MSAPRSEPVYRITAAGTPLSEDLRGRTRRYLVSMGVRTACFLGAVVVSGPLRWVLIVAAVLLPYLAVVLANAGRDSGSGSALPIAVFTPKRGQIGSPDGPAGPASP